MTPSCLIVCAGRSLFLALSVVLLVLSVGEAGAPQPEPRIDRPASGEYQHLWLTCLHARTGALLWRVAFPRLSGNYQTHKWRGFNATAYVIGPAVIAAIC